MAARFSLDEVLQATRGTAHQRARLEFEGVSTDTRAPLAGGLFVALKGERFDGHAYAADALAAGAAGVVVQRGHAPAKAQGTVVEVDDTLAALGALARFHRLRFNLPLAAVTGSNGKTTTKELLGAILATRGPILKTRGNLNNEIGLPLTLLGLESSHVAGVVEMGMNHLGEIARMTAIARPTAGVITVVQPVHLEGLGSIEGVAQAKGELFFGLPAGAIAAVNADDPHIVEQAARAGVRAIRFGRSPGVDVQLRSVAVAAAGGLEVVLRVDGIDLDLNLHFFGEHNAMNAAAAVATALAMGFTFDECRRGIASARPEAHRMQLVVTPAGVRLLDDCYNANPESMRAAVVTGVQLAAPRKPVFVLGDMLELGAAEASAHAQLRALALAQGRAVAFFGPRFAQVKASATSDTPSENFDDPEAVAAWLSPRLAAGDLVVVKGSRGMKLERVIEALGGPAAGAH